MIWASGLSMPLTSRCIGHFKWIDWTIAMDLGTITQMGFNLDCRQCFLFNRFRSKLRKTDCHRGNLIPCSTLPIGLYRWQEEIIFKETSECHPFRHDTSLIYHEMWMYSVYFADKQTRSGNYYHVSNDTTYFIIMVIIRPVFYRLTHTLYIGNSISSMEFSTFYGNYNIAFDTDIHGCDSIVILDLTMRRL
jgi:hypothetical protein